MERTQAVQNLDKLLPEIELHFIKTYPKEGCGLLGVRDGELHWLACKNIATEDENFIIDSREFFKYKRMYDIVGVVHSHPDSSCEPSEVDINVCNSLCIPYYIFSYPTMEMYYLEPEVNNTELYGRDYEFGKADCFEAIRDYLATKNILLPPRELFGGDYFPQQDGFWETNTEYLSPEKALDWDHKKVELKDIRENDVLIFKVYSPVNNHCGVYLGDDIFYHHAQNRLSTRESLYPFWAKFLTGAYRYEA